MKRTLLVIFIAGLALAAGLAVSFHRANAAPRAHQAAAQQDDAQLGAGQPVVLCLPGIYMTPPGDCIPSGPAGYLTQMAQRGITLPIPPLPASAPDPTLKNINVYYGEVHTANAPVYGSLEDAVQNKKKTPVSP